jgi:hypothetical protein
VTANETGPAAKSAPTKQRAATRTIRPAAHDAIRDVKQQLGDAASAARRPLYDYYDDAGDRGDRQDSALAPGQKLRARPDLHDGRRTLRGASKTKSRIIVRRQDGSDQSDDRSDDDRALPPQPPPAQSFFGGLFGQ